MKTYKVINQGKRTFTLSRNEQTLAQLAYTKWYNHNAKIRLADHSEYTIVSKGFFGRTIEVIQNDTTYIHYKMGWRGINITTNFEGEEKKYFLKLKGMFSSTFLLLDAFQNELLETKSNFKWNKLHSDYELICTGHFDTLKHQELMLLVFYHALKYQLAAMAAAA